MAVPRRCSRRACRRALRPFPPRPFCVRPSHRSSARSIAEVIVVTFIRLCNPSAAIGGRLGQMAHSGRKQKLPEIYAGGYPGHRAGTRLRSTQIPFSHNWIGLWYSFVAAHRRQQFLRASEGNSIASCLVTLRTAPSHIMPTMVNLKAFHSERRRSSLASSGSRLNRPFGIKSFDILQLATGVPEFSDHPLSWRWHREAQ